MCVSRGWNQDLPQPRKKRATPDPLTDAVAMLTSSRDTDAILSRNCML